MFVYWQLFAIVEARSWTKTLESKAQKANVSRRGLRFWLMLVVVSKFVLAVCCARPSDPHTSHSAIITRWRATGCWMSAPKPCLDHSVFVAVWSRVWFSGCRQNSAVGLARGQRTNFEPKFAFKLHLVPLTPSIFARCRNTSLSPSASKIARN